MSEVNERIEEIIEGFSGGKTEFARATGIDFKTQRNYVNGRNKPSFDFLVNLHALREDVLYVLTGVRSVPEGFVRVPKLLAEGSMGTGLAENPTNDYAVDQIIIAKEWLWKNLPSVTSYKNLHLITGRGDSMSGTYEDGDTLFVDSGVTEFQTDGIYLFEIERDMFIKRLQKLPKGKFKALSDNPVYDSFIIEPNDGLHILGKVIGSWKFVKH